MKTAIIYCSKYGTTEKVASMIADKIGTDNDVTLISLADNPSPDISGYEKVILGTSIFAGKPRSGMTKFCKRYEHLLSGKILGLYICGMQPNKSKEELQGAYPVSLHEAAKTEAFLGGELLMDKLNFIVRRIMKRMVKTDSSVHELDMTAIDNFANKMN